MRCRRISTAVPGASVRDRRGVAVVLTLRLPSSCLVPGNSNQSKQSETGPTLKQHAGILKLDQVDEHCHKAARILVAKQLAEWRPARIFFRFLEAIVNIVCVFGTTVVLPYLWMPVARLGGKASCGFAPSLDPETTRNNMKYNEITIGMFQFFFQLRSFTKQVAGTVETSIHFWLIGVVLLLWSGSFLRSTSKTEVSWVSSGLNGG